MTAAITVNGDREAMGFARAQPILRASTRVCPNVKCKGIVFVIESLKGIVEIEPPQLLDFNTEGPAGF